MKRIDPEDIKVTYEYAEPKSEQEANEAQQKLVKAYDIIFDETIKRIREKNNDKFSTKN